MKRTPAVPRLALSCLLSVGAVGTGIACTGAEALAQAPSKPEGQAGESFPDFNAVIKDMQPIPGLMTLYRYKPDDATKDQSKLLCVIPKALLKQDMLLATSISRGSMMGYQWNDFLVRWEMVGKRLLLTVPDARYVETPGQPVTDAVTRTYTSSFLTALPILTMTPAGDPVVDLGAAVFSKIADVPVPAGFEPRRDLSKYTKVKVFPDNILIDVDLAVANRNGMGANVGVSYAFRRLPELKGYAPRVADERVGYFTTVRQDWATKHWERETLLRYVNRWNLKKKDPSLELSPPEKPIVFIIEKTVPLQWRRYVAEGILEWNKAFEKIGFTGAIVVQQQTDDNEFADIDPEDARYNFIRWIVTGRGFAMGPSRADPRTGQILDADIIFDDAMLRYYFDEFDVIGPGGPAAMNGPELMQFLQENPAFIPMGQTLEQVRQAAEATGTPSAMPELMRDLPPQAAAPSQQPVGTSALTLAARNRAPASCNYAVGMKHQLAMMGAAALGTPSGKKLPERVIGMALKETVSHEVGHTLGLRHNFKASSWLGLEEIKRRRESGEPFTASVMDYNTIVLLPGDEIEKVKNFTTPTVGPYDNWAIEYGYKQPGKEDGDEKTMLAKIAGRSTQRELAYATDEDTMGPSSPDPMVNRWDLSEDPVSWARARIELVDALMKDVRKSVKKDEPKHYLRGTFATLLFEKARNMQYVSRVVGGQYFSRARAGDADAKAALSLVDPKLQRDAMAMLGETIFNDNFFALDTDLLNDLPPSRWWDWASTASPRVDYPIHQTIGSLQAYALMNLCTPQVLQRVYDAELKSKADDKFTAAELIAGVRNTIWGELQLKDGDTFTDAKPMLSSVRRNLQKQHLQYMLANAEAQPGSLMTADLQSMVRFSLRELSDQIGLLLAKTASNGGVAGKLDFATKAHLTEAKSQIDRVLNAPHIKMPTPQIMLMMSAHEPAPQPQQP